MLNTLKQVVGSFCGAIVGGLTGFFGGAWFSLAFWCIGGQVGFFRLLPFLGGGVDLTPFINLALLCLLVPLGALHGLVSGMYIGLTQGFLAGWTFPKKLDEHYFKRWRKQSELDEHIKEKDKKASLKRTIAFSSDCNDIVPLSLTLDQGEIAFIQQLINKLKEDDRVAAAKKLQEKLDGYLAFLNAPCKPDSDQIVADYINKGGIITLETQKRDGQGKVETQREYWEREKLIQGLEYQWRIEGAPWMLGVVYQTIPIEKEAIISVTVPPEIEEFIREVRALSYIDYKNPDQLLSVADQQLIKADSVMQEITQAIPVVPPPQKISSPVIKLSPAQLFWILRSDPNKAPPIFVSGESGLKFSETKIY